MKLGIITIHSSHLIVSQITPVLAGRSSLEVFWPAGCEAISKPAELAAFLRASFRSMPPGSAVSVRALLRPWAPPAPALASSAPREPWGCHCTRSDARGCQRSLDVCSCPQASSRGAGIQVGKQGAAAQGGCAGLAVQPLGSALPVGKLPVPSPALLLVCR